KTSFLTESRDRLAPEHRIQLTTDGFHLYHRCVEDIFAGRADFAERIKLYGDSGQHDAAGRYSPQPIMETIVRITGWPSRSSPYKYQLRGTAKPHNAHGDPAIHPPDKCLLREARQSESDLRSALRLLQSLPDTQNAPSHPSEWKRGLPITYSRYENCFRKPLDYVYAPTIPGRLCPVSTFSSLQQTPR